MRIRKWRRASTPIAPTRSISPVMDSRRCAISTPAALRRPDDRIQGPQDPWRTDRGVDLAGLDGFTRRHPAGPHGVRDDKYRDWIMLEFDCRVIAVDVETGIVTFDAGSNAPTRAFDFIIGGDGAGSVVRKAMREQVPGFTVETRSFPNYCTMIELDRVGDDMDPHYLHGLSVRPFCVAGAIKADAGSDGHAGSAPWARRPSRRSPHRKRRGSSFGMRVPRVLELTSDEKIAAFAERTCYHIGQTLTCSQLHGGKAVLLGDAAAAFPPIGQGVNAAMESAMVLDLCIGETGASADGLLEAADLTTRVAAGGRCRLVDGREEPVRESRPHAPRVDHVAARHQHLRSGEERRRPVLRGPAQGRAALAAVDVNKPRLSVERCENVVGRAGVEPATNGLKVEAANDRA